MLPSLRRIIVAGLAFRAVADARPYAAANALPSTSTTISSPSASISQPHNMSSPMTILMGSYSSPESAHVIYFTPPTTAEGTDGKLVVGPSHKLGESASWFAQHPKHADVVYGVLEKEPENGEIVQVRLGQDAKEAKVEGTRSTLGAAPAHCAVVADGKALAVANYAGGSVFLQPLEADGSFSSSPGNLIKFPFEPTKTPLRNDNRQEASHPHEVVEVVVEAGRTEIWVPDLGQDKIWRLELEEKAGVVSWKLKEGAHVAGDDGGGPRHIVANNRGKDLYVMNELLPNVVHVKVDGDKTSFKSKTSVIAPPPAEPVAQNTFPSGSELLLLNSTKPHPTLVASTRTLFDRPTDALAFFSVLPSGELELQQFAYPKGREFRATGASKDGRFVVTGGQSDGWVSVLGQDENGLWRPVAEPVQVDKPTGVLFL